MLRVQHLSVNGRRDDLLPPTSLGVRRGELLLVSGTRPDQRTALALALSGRLKPSAGHFGWDGEEWDGAAGTRTLRQASAVVDSPGVNEPEQHLSVRDLVTEDLALIPRRYRGPLPGAAWLKVNGFEDIAALWAEQLPAARRIGLLTKLALANPRTDLLVLDTPDRHGDPGCWLPGLEELAYDAWRPLAVVAVVMSVPPGWTGPSAAIGNAVPATSAAPDPAGGTASAAPEAAPGAAPGTAADAETAR